MSAYAIAELTRWADNLREENSRERTEAAEGYARALALSGKVNEREARIAEIEAAIDVIQAAAADEVAVLERAFVGDSDMDRLGASISTTIRGGQVNGSIRVVPVPPGDAPRIEHVPHYTQDEHHAEPSA